jgi:predicted alpha/beta hydrolase family esterase
MPNIHKVKVCAICGMSKKDHWDRHWKSYHPGASRQELPFGGVPSAPHKEDWVKDIEPSSLREQYESAAKINEEVPPN